MLRGEDYSFSADVYSFGVILYAKKEMDEEEQREKLDREAVDRYWIQHISPKGKSMTWNQARLFVKERGG